MWNNISKRHGHLLLLIITTCKAWKCLRCSYFLNDWLAPLFIHIRKKPSGERKSSVAAETWKSHFWHCSLVDVILGNVLLKAMIFQGEEIYIFFFIAGCLWALIAPSEVRPKSSQAFFCLVWRYPVKPALKHESKIFTGHFPQPLPAYTFWIFSLGASQPLGLFTSCWKGWFSPAMWKH